MATTETLPSGRFRGIYRDAAGVKKHTPVVDRKRDALNDARDAEHKAKRQARAKEGRLPPHTLWSHWCEIWWAKRNLEVSTDRNESKIRDRELLPVWGEKPLNKITKQDIQDWVDTLAARKSRYGGPHAAGYIRKIFALFRTSILAAVDAEILGVNPCAKVRVPKAVKTTVRHFERPAYESILKALRPHHRAAVEFLWETGIRPGELAGLHWNHVQRDRGWLIVADVLPRDTGVIKSCPKDEEPREIPLTSRALELLDQWAETQPPRRGCGMLHTNGKTCRSDLIFRQRNGSPLSLSSFTAVFTRAVAKANASGSLYSLRHSFGTRLAEAGLDPYEISRLMGHSNLAQTLTYVHRTADARRRILAALGDRGTSPLQLVKRAERGTGRGTRSPSSRLPNTPSGASSQAG